MNEIDDFLTDCGVTTEAALDELRNFLFDWKRKHGADAVVLIASLFEEADKPGGTAKFKCGTIQYGNPDLCSAILNRTMDEGVTDDRMFANHPNEEEED